jgi:uncharacterized membrane protein (DUF2068 family)
MKDRSSATLVAIGVFKLVKSILLFALGLVLIFWQDQGLGQVAQRWMNTLWAGRPFFETLVSKLNSLHQRTINEVATASFVYSALLLVEGVGLCRRKRWAEYLTVAITASLLPFEFYQLFHQLTPTSTFVTIVNIAILWYLIIRLIHDRRR